MHEDLARKILADLDSIIGLHPEILKENCKIGAAIDTIPKLKIPLGSICIAYRLEVGQCRRVFDLICSNRHLEQDDTVNLLDDLDRGRLNIIFIYCLPTNVVV